MVTPADTVMTEADNKNSAFGRGKFRIPGDVVKTAISDLPETQRGAIWWFAQWVAKNIVIKADLGRVLKKSSGEYYSHDSIIQLLTGGRIRRGENIEPLLDAITKLRSVEDLRSDQVNSGFVQTRLYAEISRRSQKALKRQRILWMFGDSQIGKSASLKEYARTQPHGQTVYLELPACGSLGSFLRTAADWFNIASICNQGQLMDRVIDCIDSNMLVIVDEFHNALGGRSLATAAFIRELWNRKQCGMVLAMTNEGKNMLLNGPNSKKLEQLWRRRITPLQLPNVTPDDDAALFAKAYGLAPACDERITIKVTYVDANGITRSREHSDNALRLQHEVLKTEGLGVWISILQDAADMAQEQRKPITWGAVIKAACQASADSEIYN